MNGRLRSEETGAEIEKEDKSVIVNPDDVRHFVPKEQYHPVVWNRPKAVPCSAALAYPASASCRHVKMGTVPRSSCVELAAVQSPFLGPCEGTVPVSLD